MKLNNLIRWVLTRKLPASWVCLCMRPCLAFYPPKPPYTFRHKDDGCSSQAGRCVRWAVTCRLAWKWAGESCLLKHCSYVLRFYSISKYHTLKQNCICCLKCWHRTDREKRWSITQFSKKSDSDGKVTHDNNILKKNPGTVPFPPEVSLSAANNQRCCFLLWVLTHVHNNSFLNMTGCFMSLNLF